MVSIAICPHCRKQLDGTEYRPGFLSNFAVFKCPECGYRGHWVKVDKEEFEKSKDLK